MSLFRKPTKKIQRRVLVCDDDEDGEPEPPPPPVISKKENKHVKAKLLSFADEEEEEVEVFKVKKSSQSKRLAKKREKEKKKDSDNNCENITEVTTPANQTKNDKPKKKVTLEGLILTGREALAADGSGDVEDEEEEAEEVDETGFHRYRAESVRALLATAEIPDAALIHAARKTRQQAREMGGGDYIPVRNELDRKGPGSRLIRDDGSDDEEEGRIEVRGLELPSDKPQRGTMALDEEELDSAGEEWVEQQIKKAVPTITDIAGDMVNPFAVAPPPPVLDDPHLRPLVPPPTSAGQLLDGLAHRIGELRCSREQTALRRTSVCDRLLAATRRRDRCEAAKPTLEAAYRRAQGNRGYVTDLIECLDEKMPELEALESRALSLYRRRCEFIQERRRQDVSDQALDVRTLTSRAAKPPDSEEKIRRTAEREGRRRARRLERDRLQRTNHREGDSSDDELPPSEAHHYNAEKEAIRVASSQLFSDALPRWRSVRGVCARLSRWKSRDRDSYVDAYLPHFLIKLLAPYVRHQLILWNPFADEDNEDLEKMDWYKCVMMYGVTSSPVSSDSDLSPSEDPEDPDVTEDGVREDPDLYLLPNMVQKVVIPKLTGITEIFKILPGSRFGFGKTTGHTNLARQLELVSCWDPVSVRSCVRVRGVVVRLSGSMSGRAVTLSALSTALYTRLADCIAADVFLPPLPPLISEGPGGAFWRRCVGAGVRLLRGILALTPPPDLLRADPLVLALIGTLCTAAAAAPPTLVASAAVDLATTLPRHPSPLRTAALRRLATLAQYALNNLHSDNPLHLKALEQARSVIAEAKAAEQMVNCE